ncbi:hypothetical protein EJ06DRAFT_547366 [Trichodelitschia bisporula]|uniref:Ubiquitin-like protease family profile domain-containing protein n=1 Tax=Trichodelitschia bisporula TaxID=703511 RepID=A0A6G1I4Y6_9PEZI|nr:hypothetical protein EJ06DRAFT_547366 [Trichodelitschia bisporula]
MRSAIATFLGPFVPTLSNGSTVASSSSNSSREPAEDSPEVGGTSKAEITGKLHTDDAPPYTVLTAALEAGGSTPPFKPPYRPEQTPTSRAADCTPQAAAGASKLAAPPHSPRPRRTDEELRFFPNYKYLNPSYSYLLFTDRIRNPSDATPISIPTMGNKPYGGRQPSINTLNEPRRLPKLTYGRGVRQAYHTVDAHNERVPSHSYTFRGDSRPGKRRKTSNAAETEAEHVQIEDDEMDDKPVVRSPSPEDLSEVDQLLSTRKSFGASVSSISSFPSINEPLKAVDSKLKRKRTRNKGKSSEERRSDGTTGEAASSTRDQPFVILDDDVQPTPQISANTRSSQSHIVSQQNIRPLHLGGSSAPRMTSVQSEYFSAAQAGSKISDDGSGPNDLSTNHQGLATTKAKGFILLDELLKEDSSTKLGNVRAGHVISNDDDDLDELAGPETFSAPLSKSLHLHPNLTTPTDPNSQTHPQTDIMSPNDLSSNSSSEKPVFLEVTDKVLQEARMGFPLLRFRTSILDIKEDKSLKLVSLGGDTFELRGSEQLPVEMRMNCKNALKLLFVWNHPSRFGCRLEFPGRSIQDLQFTQLDDLRKFASMCDGFKIKCHKTDYLVDKLFTRPVPPPRLAGRRGHVEDLQALRTVAKAPAPSNLRRTRQSQGIYPLPLQAGEKIPRQHATLRDLLAAELEPEAPVTRATRSAAKAVSHSAAQRTERRVSPKAPPYSVEPGLGAVWTEPVVYPQTGKKKTTVTFADLFRLDEGEFLNDNLIEFYLRRTQEQHPERATDVYFFGTHFYSTLKADGHSGVENWTKRDDIFSYDYAVVPINEHSHWYLALIVNLPLVKKPPATEEVEQGGPKKKLDRVTVIVFDSMGTRRPGTIKTLKTYLMNEAKAKLGVDIAVADLQGTHARGTPQQQNLSDCGLFLSGYVEKFMADPKGFVEKYAGTPSNDSFDEQEWLALKPTRMRHDIREILQDLARAQEEARQHKQKKSSKSTEAKPTAPSNSTAGTPPEPPKSDGLPPPTECQPMANGSSQTRHVSEPFQEKHSARTSGRRSSDSSCSSKRSAPAMLADSLPPSPKRQRTDSKESLPTNFVNVGQDQPLHPVQVSSPVSSVRKQSPVGLQHKSSDKQQCAQSTAVSFHSSPKKEQCGHLLASDHLLTSHHPQSSKMQRSVRAESPHASVTFEESIAVMPYAASVVTAHRQSTDIHQSDRAATRRQSQAKKSSDTFDCAPKTIVNLTGTPPEARSNLDSGTMQFGQRPESSHSRRSSSGSSGSKRSSDGMLFNEFEFGREKRRRTTGSSANAEVNRLEEGLIEYADKPASLSARFLEKRPSNGDSEFINADDPRGPPNIISLDEEQHVERPVKKPLIKLSIAEQIAKHNKEKLDRQRTGQDMFTNMQHSKKKEQEQEDDDVVCLGSNPHAAQAPRHEHRASTPPRRPSLKSPVHVTHLSPSPQPIPKEDSIGPWGSTAL